MANQSIDTSFNKTCILVAHKCNDRKHNQANAKTKEYPSKISERTQDIGSIKSEDKVNEQSY